MQQKQKPIRKKTENADKAGKATDTRPKELGGRGGPDPVRYGDWEMNGKCVDF